MGDALTIVRGKGADAPVLLGLFDDAVTWLVARGQVGQWAPSLFSERPAQVERVRAWAEAGGLGSPCRCGARARKPPRPTRWPTPSCG